LVWHAPLSQQQHFWRLIPRAFALLTENGLVTSDGEINFSGWFCYLLNSR
jgi:hypothetical protein